jgi:hypothetical protein
MESIIFCIIINVYLYYFILFHGGLNMRKYSFTLLLLLFIPALILADPFAPTLLIVTAPTEINFNPYGTSVMIPFTISGTNARVVLVVYTYNKGNEIGTVENGYLGWHRVNKIDTCLYISQPSDFTPGSHTIEWNLTDSYGTVLQENTYRYYLWAYDHTAARKRATTNAINIDRQCIMPLQYDEAGLAINPPKLLSMQRTGYGGIPENYVRLWTLGNDPETNTHLETCDFHESWQSGTVTEWGWRQSMPWALDICDHTVMYVGRQNKTTKTKALFKEQWITNGDAIRFELWGQDLRWGNVDWQRGGGVMSIPNEELILCDGHSKYGTVPQTWSWIINYDGEQLYEFENEWFIDLDAYNSGINNTPNEGPEFMYSDGFGKFYYADWTCMQLCFNPLAYMTEFGGSESYHDMDIWVNKNGDFYYDQGYWGDNPTWSCVGLYSYKSRSVYSDRNGFMTRGLSGMDGISFLLFGPDGYGIGKFTWADEITSMIDMNQQDVNEGEGVFMINSGTAFDGAYTDHSNTVGNYQGIWYVPYDSFKGILNSGGWYEPDSVDEVSPSAFSVSQNSPNPFNSVTTISFTISEPGNVTVDIFNVAGQKVTALANGQMSAGSHSVIWDASNFSAGIYFYTVKTGSHTRTIKMTLLK